MWYLGTVMTIPTEDWLKTTGLSPDHPQALAAHEVLAFKRVVFFLVTKDHKAPVLADHDAQRAVLRTMTRSRRSNLIAGYFAAKGTSDLVES